MQEKAFSKPMDNHTFETAVGGWTRDSACRYNESNVSDTYIPCNLPYSAHDLRPPLPTEVLEKEPGSVGPDGFMDSHKYGCASVVEAQRGPCNCGYMSWNLGALMFLAQKGLSGYESHLRWRVLPDAVSQEDVTPTRTMPSTEFRTSYAGEESPVTVTVNGRPIGRWTPYIEEPNATR